MTQCVTCTQVALHGNVVSLSLFMGVVEECVLQIIVPYSFHSCMKVFFSKLGPPDYYAHGTPTSTAEERLADSVSLVPKKTEIVN